MSALEQRREWAAAHIRDAKSRGVIPRYGDPDWHLLAPTDPRRWAAVIIAAECWAVDGDDIPARVRRELAEQTSVASQLADEDFAQVAASIRDHARSPTHAELAKRRQEIGP